MDRRTGPAEADDGAPTTAATAEAHPAERRVVGVDGCAAGWVAVTLVDGGVDHVEVVEALAEALQDEGVAAVGVDMPIGLVDDDRAADGAARALLPGRASSVFSAPPRSVVDGYREGRLTSHAEASALARERTGKGISMQAWRLVPAIREVDDLVAAGHDLREVHPELAFTLLAGAPLPRKRSWAGVTTRRAILERHGIVLPDRFPGDTDAAPDDVLDAAACAFVADGLAGAGPVIAVPAETAQRDRGRPIQIHARAAPVVVPGPRRRPRAS